MRHVKKMDFYRKYTNEDTIPTCFGAIMSVLTIFLIVFFSTFELSKYMSPVISHKVELAQYPVALRENSIPLNFDLIFHKVPCKCNNFELVLEPNHNISYHDKAERCI